MSILLELLPTQTDEMRPLTLRVQALHYEASGILTVDLVAPGGADLPQADPGAHLDIAFTPQIVRQYSLSGDVTDRSKYSITVARDTEGRGGSAHVHDALRPGTLVRASTPANNFGLVDAEQYVFIAGGIGVTPFRPMILAAELAGKPWELHLAVRDRENIAFASWLAQYPDRVHTFVAAEGARLSVTEIAAQAGGASAVYCCGPERMMLEAEEAGKASGRAVRVERFHPKEAATPLRSGSFTVLCSRSGVSLTVPPEQSILEVLEAADLPVRASCREGTCGTCELSVLRGVPDHRDSLLSDEEKEENDTMMVCVSRAISDELELDI